MCTWLADITSTDTAVSLLLLAIGNVYMMVSTQALTHLSSLSNHNITCALLQALWFCGTCYFVDAASDTGAKEKPPM